MIRSGRGRDIRSSSTRISPCTNWIPSPRSRFTFSDDPARRRLSSTTTDSAARLLLSEMARLEPTKPAPPVTRRHLYMRFAGRFVFHRRFRLTVIVPSRKIFFEPQVKNDEEIAAAHFLQLQLGNGGLAVSPRNRDGGVGITAHDRLEGQLDRQIEVRRDDRLNARNYFLTVALERICDIVEAEAEGQHDEPIRQSINDQLVPGIPYYLPTRSESRAEHAIESLLDLLVIADQVFGTIGTVCHHDGYGIARR